MDFLAPNVGEVAVGFLLVDASINRAVSRPRVRGCPSGRYCINEHYEAMGRWSSNPRMPVVDVHGTIPSRLVGWGGSI
jgi:hypothetical protein